MYNSANNPRELKDLILRRLGAPIINVEVTEEQIFSCIQQAIELYGEYHYDALNKSYVVVQLDEKQAKTGLIDLRQYKLFAVTRIVRKTNGVAYTLDGNATLSYVSDFLSGLTGGISKGNCSYYGPMGNMGDLSYYSQLMSYQNTIFDQLNPIPDYAYNTSTGYLNVIGNQKEGDILVLEVFSKYYMELDESMNANIVGSKNSIAGYAEQGLQNPWQNPFYGYEEPEIGDDTKDFADQQVYNVRWVKDYCTALVKYQNGYILSRHQGLQLPGGVTVDGLTILTEAKEEIARLRDELYSLEECSPIIMG